jgi:tetratricopeptide (TPR) repeat protein
MKHLSLAEVEALVGGRLNAAERKRTVRHLLSGCRVCGRRLAAAAPDLFFGETPSGVRSAEDAYDAPLDRAAAAALDFQTLWRRDRERSARCLDLIRRSPQGYDGLSFEQVQEFQGRPLVEALLQASFEARFKDHKAMRWLAYNAVTAADSLRPEEYGRGLTFDLRARAWAELANAYRVNEEIDEAEEAFRRARTLLAQGTGSLLLLARVADLEASLLSDQRRLAEACELLDGVYRLYLDLGDPHLAGQALVKKAIATRYGGDPRQGVEIFRQALSLLDAEREPQLVAVCQQGLVGTLADCGQFGEAGRLLLESGLRRTFAAEPIALLKVRWVEARILGGLGKLPQAETALIEVRNEFLRLQNKTEAALVGLDLAAVWLRQKKGRELEQLSRSMLATFRYLGAQQEADEALRFLRETSTIL